METLFPWVFLPTKVFQGFIEAHENHIQIIRKRFRIKKGLLQVDQPRVSQINKLQFPQIPNSQSKNAKRRPHLGLGEESANTLRNPLISQRDTVML